MLLVLSIYVDDTFTAQAFFTPAVEGTITFSDSESSFSSSSGSDDRNEDKSPISNFFLIHHHQVPCHLYRAILFYLLQKFGLMK